MLVPLFINTQASFALPIAKLSPRFASMVVLGLFYLKCSRPRFAQIKQLEKKFDIAKTLDMVVPAHTWYTFKIASNFSLLAHFFRHHGFCPSKDILKVTRHFISRVSMQYLCGKNSRFSYDPSSGSTLSHSNK